MKGEVIAGSRAGEVVGIGYRALFNRVNASHISLTFPVRVAFDISTKQEGHMDERIPRRRRERLSLIKVTSGTNPARGLDRAATLLKLELGYLPAADTRSGQNNT